MKRLTQKDWDLINKALALYECEQDAEGDHAEETPEAIRATRVKVWERDSYQMEVS